MISIRSFIISVKNYIAKKRSRTIVFFSLVSIGYVLACAGIFSYFTGYDAVTNKLSADHGSVQILEPAWDSKGKAMAQQSEPGMDIPKDPRGYNDGDVPLYIRLSMRIRLSAADNRNLEGSDENDGDYVGQPDKIKRMKAVIGAIMLDNEHSISGKEEPFITVATTDPEIKNWRVLSCNNKLFYCDMENHSKNSDEVEYWFYYTGESGSDPDQLKMERVDPANETAQLFQQISVPVYKREYYGVFDQKYQIFLKAEGVPVEFFGDKVPTVNEFEAAAR